ncbi:MAG: type II toxin-antitoxin system RelE/ParE family toxin [Candidatus Micrarchaeota archaeon]
MSYVLLFTDTFESDLKELDKPIKLRLEKLILKIKEHPKSAGKPISGKFNRFSTRFENYRLIYDVDDKKQTILLLTVKSRDEVYKHFY